MKLTFIYARLEPDSDEIRYVGKADDPQGRLMRHISRAKRQKNHCANWLRSLAARGLLPRTEIIAEVPVSEWQFWEKHFIKCFQDLGFDLVNATPGGDGFGSGPDSPNFGKKRIFSAQHRKNLGESRAGILHTPETKEKMSRAKLGKRRGPHSPECREKMRQAALRRGPWTEELRALVMAGRSKKKS